MRKYQDCGGAVLYTTIGHVPHYAVVVESDGHCGLPKGHIEHGETQRAAALREIKEETGITATLREDFSADVAYELPNGDIKRTTYFIATYSGQEVKCNDKELLAVMLLPFEAAISKITHPQIKDVLSHANELILCLK
ncbi:MAG: NUDIX domain-containing protein [Clostridiaceae bacterium]|nr:NUDIX domain-containing protein [Eubacteriales bacterium]